MIIAPDSTQPFKDFTHTCTAAHKANTESLEGRGKAVRLDCAYLRAAKASCDAEGSRRAGGSQ